MTPRFDLFEAGDPRLRTAVLLPSGHRAGDRRLPVLLDPYGGPAMQRVVDAQFSYLTAQWFADQGFAVVVIDGRGTPGRGPRCEKTVHGDFGAAALEDQVTGLHAAAERRPTVRTRCWRCPRAATCSTVWTRRICCERSTPSCGTPSVRRGSWDHRRNGLAQFAETFMRPHVHGRPVASSNYGPASDAGGRRGAAERRGPAPGGPRTGAAGPHRVRRAPEQDVRGQDLR
ncbi:alpha/beta hydrolase family protein [Asanoa siamensis]|uniref:alpha/beta hydrolase family protein n=1 Tax=Asanoa siamensis TaxID=926357 RepID=UPI0035712397